MIEIPKLSKPSGEDKAPRWFHVAVALSMLLSAGAALVSAVRTGATMQALVDQNARLVKAGSTPILQFYRGNVGPDGKPQLRFWVENVGTGPARIVSFQLSWNGQPMRAGEFPALVAKQEGQPPLTADDFPRQTSVVKGHVLAPGQHRALFQSSRSDMETPASQALYERMDKGALYRVEAKACYCSVFDECFETDFGPTLPQAVPRCEAPAEKPVAKAVEKPAH